jgi:TetR/AcrR family transcriptional regulator, tetracycline repressor protein
MESASDEQAGGANVNRTTLAATALELIQEDGLDALTMRTLADRSGVKAASLYWHVRDREELLELVAGALLARVSTANRGADWRESAIALCTATAGRIAAQRDGDRILHEVPGAVRRSAVHASLAKVIAAGGIDAAIAAEVAAMMIGFVVAQPSTRFVDRPAVGGKTITLAIDSGSRGVVVQAGGPMEGLFRIPHHTTTAAPAVVRDERVIVRRLRGGKRGAIDINAAHPWRVQVQGPTWNTLLDLRGINLRGVQMDSSATKIECLLPRPEGVVPIHISSGVVRVALKRIPGTAVATVIKSGAVQVTLDDVHTRVALVDTRWETPGGAVAPDRYELEVSGGAVRVSLDDSATESTMSPPTQSTPATNDVLSAALGIVLDGVGLRARPASGKTR